MPPPPHEDKSLMHSLGSFFGHIWKGIKTDPTAPQKHEVRREVETEERHTPDGKVILRRTTIEEVEVRPPTRPTK